jgi:hypothetical protein
MFLEASPGIEDGLTYFADKAGYTAMESDDTAYDIATSTGYEEGSSTSTPTFVFADKTSTNTDSITATWIGRSTVGADTRNIVLQIYRFGSTSTQTGWKTITTEISCNADQDCTVSGSTSTDLTDFYFPHYRFNASTGTTSPEFWTFWRIYQVGGSQTLRSDQWTIAYGALAITISGTVYSDEGQGTLDCGVSCKVSLKVNGADACGGACTDTTSGGAYSIADVTIGAVDDVITVYIDDETENAVTITKASSTSADITGLDLYENRVITKHEDSPATAITLSDMDQYDADEETDGDIPFRVTGGAATTTTIFTDNKLYVWPNKTLSSDGEIIVIGNGSSGGATDGDLHIASGATYTAGATTTIGGDWIASSTAIFNDGGYTVVFNATTTKQIWSIDGADFGALDFNGSGGTWNLMTAATSSATTTITNGTLVQSANDNLDLASLTIQSNGTFTKASGSGLLFFEDPDPIFIQDVDENNNLGDVYIGYSPAVTNQKSDLVTDSLTVNSGDTHNTKGYEIDSATFIDVSGTLNASDSGGGEGDLTNIFLGTDWTIQSGGTFTHGNSTTTFDGTASGNTITTQGTGNPFYTIYVDGLNGAWQFASGDHDIDHDFIINQGTVTSTSGTLQVGGSWTNSDTFVPNSGTVTFDSTDTGETVNPGDSSFNIVTFDNDNGGWTITNEAQISQLTLMSE